MLLSQFFQFSPERFKNPFVIAGLVIMVLGMIVVIFLGKILRKPLEEKELEKIRNKKITAEHQIRDIMNNVEYKARLIGKVVGALIIIFGCVIALIGV